MFTSKLEGKGANILSQSAIFQCIPVSAIFNPETFPKVSSHGLRNKLLLTVVGMLEHEPNELDYFWHEYHGGLCHLHPPTTHTS